MNCLITSLKFYGVSKQCVNKRFFATLSCYELTVPRVRTLQPSISLRADTPALIKLCIPQEVPNYFGIVQNVSMSSSSKGEDKSESASCDIKENEPDTSTLSTKEKLKIAVRDYGTTVIIFHVGISLISLGGFYLAASSGLNVQDMVESIGFDSQVTAATVGSAGTFVVAYAIHKVFAPVRITITLASAPFIVRYLRSKGILKVKAKDPK